MKNLFLILFSIVTLLNTTFAQSIDPSNPANPFDKIGYHHNESMKFTLNKYGADSLANNPHLIKRGIKIYSEREVKTWDLQQFQAYFNSPDRTTLNQSTDLKQTLAQEYNWSPEAITLLTNIEDLFVSTRPYGDMTVLHDDIKALENTILNSSTLRIGESYPLLAMTSVARHTSVLWIDAQQNPRTLYDFPDNSVTTAGFGDIDPGKIILADAIGAIKGGVVGGIIGGIAGWLGGPLGSAAGAEAGFINGAQWGAAKASLGELIDQLFFR